MAFEVEQIVGAGNVQQLVCQTLDLPKPAEEIKELRKTVIIDNCTVVFDKVIIDGRLRKDIMFKEADKGFPRPGTVKGCGGVVGSVCGPIMDLDVDIAFNALIPVPGAEPGDRCVVLQAFVEGEKEEAANINDHGAFHTLIDKSIVFLCVKVVRDTVSNGVNGCNQITGPLCPERRSTGFFPGGNGRIPRPQPGPVPGTWIGPTLIFPGVLNPGIPDTVPQTRGPRHDTSTLVQVTGQSVTPDGVNGDVFGGTTVNGGGAMT